jgi:hypothetical protein
MITAPAFAFFPFCNLIFATKGFLATRDCLVYAARAREYLAGQYLYIAITDISRIFARGILLFLQAIKCNLLSAQILARLELL